MHYAPSQQVEGVGTAPPAGGICRIAVVGEPEVPLIVLDAVQVCNFLRLIPMP